MEVTETASENSPAVPNGGTTRELAHCSSAGVPSRKRGAVLETAAIAQDALRTPPAGTMHS